MDSTDRVIYYLEDKNGTDNGYPISSTNPELLNVNTKYYSH